MGYDMHVVDEQGKNVKCDNDYWRRNIFGSTQQAEKLVELGMASWPTERRGEFPQRPDHIEEAYAKARAADDWDYEHPDYTAVLFPYLKARNGATVGINAAKLCDTNDGWWVTREECQEALKVWEASGKPPVDDFGRGPLGDTIPFLQAAAEHHGFRVY